MTRFRVLDLTDEGAGLCGLVLADLGADVRLIEPPSGLPSRHRGPYAGESADPERALGFWAVHRNKQSLVLDLTTAADRQRLRELARDADVIIDGGTQPALRAHGLDAQSLCAEHPRLVGVTISAYGCTGPKADWPATDLTATAASMALYITGDADRPPLSATLPQAFLNAGAEAAVQTLMALTERDRSGRGQHIDVSAQTAMMATTQSFCLNHAWGAPQIERTAGGARFTPAIHIRFVYRCKDGWMNFTLLFGDAIGPATRRMFEWIHEQGYCDAAMRDKDWIGYGLALYTGAEPSEEFERVKACLDAFCAAHTKAELFAGALERKLLLVPLADAADLADSAQLAARDFWRDVERTDLSAAVRFPGPFAKLSATPITYRRAPPRLGDDRGWAHAARAPRGDLHTPAAQPLAGLKVADFSWVYAGPAITRNLSDYGATVVRIETSQRVEALRTQPPYWQGEIGLERSLNYGNVNTNKLGLDLNLALPEGRALAEQLIRWADVVVENYTPRVLRAFGLDWAHVHALNPRAVMLSSCLSGQTGPLADLTGYGTMGAAIAGFGYLTGWPDRPPAGAFGAYSDYTSPRLATAALLAALMHQRETGAGQYIDVSQSEASMLFLTEVALDHACNGFVTSPQGNRHCVHAPSGVYPTLGDGRWVALAATDQTQWHALCRVAGTQWADDVRYATPAARRQHADPLDADIARWSAAADADALVAALIAADVPAHIVSTSADLFADPQLAHRGHFITLNHPQMGPTPWENARAILSRTPADVHSTGPMYGEHNQLVLSELLGLDDDAIAELVIAGAIG